MSKTYQEIHSFLTTNLQALDKDIKIIKLSLFPNKTIIVKLHAPLEVQSELPKLMQTLAEELKIEVQTRLIFTSRDLPAEILTFLMAKVPNQHDLLRIELQGRQLYVTYRYPEKLVGRKGRLLKELQAQLRNYELQIMGPEPGQLPPISVATVKHKSLDTNGILQTLKMHLPAFMEKPHVGYHPQKGFFLKISNTYEDEERIQAWCQQMEVKLHCHLQVIFNHPHPKIQAAVEEAFQPYPLKKISFLSPKVIAIYGTTKIPEPELEQILAQLKRRYRCTFSFHLEESGHSTTATRYYPVRFLVAMDWSSERRLLYAPVLGRLQVDEQVRQELAKLDEQYIVSQRQHRRDLRDLKTITIDPPQAQDFDDALSLIRTAEGYHLWVHIADVCAWVPRNSALDQLARKRAVSIYCPDKTFHMLPDKLACDLASLIPCQDRLAVTLECQITAQGEINACQLYRSLIRVDYHYNYEQFEELLLKGFYRDWIELTRILLQQRMGKKQVKGFWAYRIVTEMMLLANHMAAVYQQGRTKGIYRVHRWQEGEELAVLLDLLQQEGFCFQGSVSLRAWLAEIRSQLSSSSELGSLLQDFIPAQYTTEEIGHQALALSAYTHFTSPLRRYADLMVHRNILESTELDKSQMDQICKECNQIAMRLQEMANAAHFLKQLYEMTKHIGANYQAVVTAMRNDEVHCFIPALKAGAYFWSSQDYGPGEQCDLKLRAVDSRRLTYLADVCQPCQKENQNDHTRKTPGGSGPR